MIDRQAILEAFKAEDQRLNEVTGGEGGHPFVTCTNIALWLRDNHFPEGKIMGFWGDDNPTAEASKIACGHDFLVVGERYIVDFWYSHIEGYDVPFVVDMLMDVEVMKNFYGDPETWEELLEVSN